MYIHIVCVSPLYNVELDVCYILYSVKVLGDAWTEDEIQHFKKEAEEREDKVKKNQEVITIIQNKQKEQYEGES